MKEEGKYVLKINSVGEICRFEVHLSMEESTRIQKLTLFDREVYLKSLKERQEREARKMKMQAPVRSVIGKSQFK